MLIDNAPPEIKTGSLKLTRPEIYYGEVTHEPVFVNTAQEEFNYPSGEQNVRARYEGTGGFPISSFAMRLAAAPRMLRSKTISRLRRAEGFRVRCSETSCGECTPKTM